MHHAPCTLLASLYILPCLLALTRGGGGRQAAGKLEEHEDSDSDHEVPPLPPPPPPSLLPTARAAAARGGPERLSRRLRAPALSVEPLLSRFLRKTSCRCSRKATAVSHAKPVRPQIDEEVIEELVAEGQMMLTSDAGAEPDIEAGEDAVPVPAGELD